MNKLLHTAALLSVSWFNLQVLHAQTHTAEIIDYRKKQIEEITAGPESPLRPEDAAGITFFEVDSKYRVQAKVEFLKGEKPFKMQTYAGKAKEFVRSARLHFEIDGVKNILTAYQNVGMPGSIVNFNKILFIPFKDKTNGALTYGGGRYLNLVIPPGSSEVNLDFNKAYNPYCVYSDGYQCPIPPRENHLSVGLPAGEKKYTGEFRSKMKN